MNSFSELAGKQKAIELLRWISVLPAAVLAYTAVGLIVSAAPNTHWLLLIFYMPKEAAFVIAGAKMAPRSRGAATIALVALGSIKSLTIHVLGQNAGLTNYLHFGAESVGVVVGAGYIFYSEIVAKGDRRKEGDSEAADGT